MPLGAVRGLLELVEVHVRAGHPLAVGVAAPLGTVAGHRGEGDLGLEQAHLRGRDPAALRDEQVLERVGGRARAGLARLLGRVHVGHADAVRDVVGDLAGGLGRGGEHRLEDVARGLAQDLLGQLARHGLAGALPDRLLELVQRRLVVREDLPDRVDVVGHQVALGLGRQRRPVELGLDRLAVERRLLDLAGRGGLLGLLADHLHARLAAGVGDLERVDHALDGRVAVQPLELQDGLGAGARIGLAERLDRAGVERPLLLGDGLGLLGLLLLLLVALARARGFSSSCHSGSGSARGNARSPPRG